MLPTKQKRRRIKRAEWTPNPLAKYVKIYSSDEITTKKKET
jgi:hypothetical protein